MRSTGTWRRRDWRRGRYRPQRAWLGWRGEGSLIRERRRGPRWRFRWKQMRVLLLAMAISAVAWSALAASA